MTAPSPTPAPAPASSSNASDPLAFLDGSAHWLGDNWLEILIAIGVGFGIYLLLEAVRTICISLCKRVATRTGSGYFAILARVVARTSHIFMALAATRIVVGYTDPPPQFYSTVNFLFTVGAVIQVALWVREFILGFIALRTDTEGSSHQTLANASGLISALVNGAIIAIAFVVILDNLGVNITGIVAGLGIGGIAIGLAAQGIFSDLFASLSIIFDKPFKVGDAINFGSDTAVVEHIGLKSTRFRAITGERKIVSNAQLLDKEITSYAELVSRRLKFAVGVIYQTSPEAAAAIPALMKDIVEANGGTFVRSGFVGFGASSLDFEVEFDVMSGAWDEVYEIRHKVGIEILTRFNAKGLEFAYPTQTTFTAAPDGQMIMPYPSSWAGDGNASGNA